MVTGLPLDHIRIGRRDASVELRAENLEHAGRRLQRAVHQRDVVVRIADAVEREGETLPLAGGDGALE